MTIGTGITPADQNHDIASDRLTGVKAIAEFWGETERRIRHLIEIGQLPVGREGAVYVASKSVLRTHWTRLTDPLQR